MGVTRLPVRAAVGILTSGLVFSVVAVPALGVTSGDCRVEAVRERPGFRQPNPPAALIRLTTEFQSSDPEADFTFFNCHVDSFATTPKSTVPDYARTVLDRAGLPVVPAEPQLLAAPTTEPKPAQELDSDLTRKVPLPDETFTGEDPTPTPQADDVVEDDQSTGVPLVEDRTRPALVLEPRDFSYSPPSAEEQAIGGRIAKRILMAFLQANSQLFEISARSLTQNLPSIKQEDYAEGRYFRKATFSQNVGGLPIIDGTTLVHFDVNWNVIGISRTIFTPEKLQFANRDGIDRTEAVSAARFALARRTGVPSNQWRVRDAVKGIDVLRSTTVWRVNLVVPAEQDFTVLVHGGNGSVLNIDDNRLGATYNASARRWAYTGGNFGSPVQVNSFVPTRDSDTLTHDTFYMAQRRTGHRRREPFLREDAEGHAMA